MANRDEDILEELKNISFLLGDLNAIRHGEYNPPSGADRDNQREPIATPDDLYSRLGTIISLLERQNSMIYNIGLNAVDNEDFWHKQNRG